MFFQSTKYKQLKLTLRPTRFCNHGCEHCFVPENRRNDPELMSEQTFKDLCIFLEKYAKHAQIEFISFLWLGGEPMEIPQSWYAMTKPYLEQLSIPYIEEMQTSGVIDMQPWENFIDTRLRKNMIMSLDLDFRTHCGSHQAYLDLWTKHYHWLLAKDCKILAILTASQAILKSGASVFIDKLLKLGLKPETTLNIRKLNSTDSTAEFMTNSEYANFLKELFQETMERFKNDQIVPNLEPITIALRGMLRHSNECATSIGEMHCCLYLPRFTVDAKGQLSQCTMHESSEYATIYDSPESLTASKQHRDMQEAFVKYSLAAMPQCRACEYSKWCFSRCFMPSFPENVLDAECNGFKSYLDFVKAFCDVSENASLAQKYLEFCGLGNNTRRYYEDHLDATES